MKVVLLRITTEGCDLICLFIVNKTYLASLFVVKILGVEPHSAKRLYDLGYLPSSCLLILLALIGRNQRGLAIFEVVERDKNQDCKIQETEQVANQNNSFHEVVHESSTTAVGWRQK